MARVQAGGRRLSTSPVGRVYGRSVRLELGTHSLALAAQHVLCAAPFLVAMSALSRTWGFGDVGHLLSDTMGLQGDAQNELMALFRTRAHETVGSFVIGFVLAFFFATGVSATMQRTFERIWDLHHADWTAAWRHLAWAVATTVLFGFALWVNKATHTWQIGTTTEVLLEATGTGVAAFVYYWWTQHVLLGGRIAARRLLPGAVLIGVGTVILIVATQVMAPAQVTEQVADYGLVGAAFILATILVAFSTTVLWGAYLGREWERRHHMTGLSDIVEPAVGGDQ
ncbi:hypothetical protein GCM10027579_03010 [Calidifontibacter terrae]